MAGYADALLRQQRAKKMQAFYEPAYFGGQRTTYSDPLGWAPPAQGSSGPPPATMGGFQWDRPLPSGSEAINWSKALENATSGRPWYYGMGTAQNPTNAPDPEMMQAWRTRVAYNAPPVGPANLANYGVGQLQRYGVGALEAYRPLVREDQLRWR